MRKFLDLYSVHICTEGGTLVLRISRSMLNLISFVNLLINLIIIQHPWKCQSDIQPSSQSEASEFFVQPMREQRNCGYPKSTDQADSAENSKSPQCEYHDQANGTTQHYSLITHNSNNIMR